MPDTVSDLCLVRISDSDGDGAVWDISDSVFSIVTDEPPACGGSWLGANYVGSDIFNSVTYGGGKFVAMGNNGTIKSSSDGINWTTRVSNTTNNLNGVAYGLNMFVVVGESGMVLTSSDGVNWTVQTSGTGNTLYSVVYGIDGFVAVGEGGTVLTGIDGVDWVDHSVNSSQTFYGAGYGNGTYVIVGGGGVVFSSADGVNWEQRSSGTTQILRGVTFGDNRFVAVGYSGVILSSEDGILWSSRSLAIGKTFLGVAYGNGVYVMVGSSGEILTGSDTVSWTVQSSGVRNVLHCVAYGNSRFVVVGAGAIIYSLCEQSTASALNYKLQNTKYKQIPNYNVQNYKRIKTGTIGPHAPGLRPPLLLLTPNGDETLQAGEKFLITWESNPVVEKVKLEYSPDNGSRYLAIATGIDNTGYYEWLVPYHMATGCLVRVSELKERKVPPVRLLYEADFRVKGVDFAAGGDIFTVYLGDAANESIKHNIPGISFLQESNGKAYITLYDSIKEIDSGKEFIGKWHNIQVLMDNANDRISVILDGELVLENIPRDLLAYFSAALSFSVGPGNTNSVDIDDVSVSAFYSQEDKNQWITLFNDDFECLNDENGLEKYGRRTKGEQNKKILATDSHRLTQTGKRFLSLSCEQSCVSQWQKNVGLNGEQVTVVKPFDIPVDFPFDVSDKPFEIRYNDDMNGDTAVHEPVDASNGYGGHGSHSNYFSTASKSTTLSTSSPGRAQSGTLVDTYYIYSFDNKLMAEYDQNGVCTKEYIYLGNRMLAEYKPQSNEYFYYMTDQINSTRVITNGNGDVVYSEAYTPYGEVQQTWTNNYKPNLKFSGKEREYYSDLDYFGARYYDHKAFRFNSVDPIINREEALVNPQLWNLYAYCRNNPVSYSDPDGRFAMALPLILNPGTAAAVGKAIGLAIAGAIALYAIINAEGDDGKYARETESGVLYLEAGEISDSVLLREGGSGKRVSPTVKHPTDKRAKDAAQSETAKGKAPVFHPAKEKDGKKIPRHWHGVDSKDKLKPKHHDVSKKKRS